MLERTIKQAQACSRIDRIFVSTDDERINAVAQAHNVAAPTLRPKHLALDSSNTIDAVLYLLDDVPVVEGYVLLLQVTTPLRRISDIERFLDAYEADDTGARAMVTLTALDSTHPNKVQCIREGRVESYMGGDPSVARQTLPETYRLNGACYLAQVDLLRSAKTFTPAGTLPFVMPSERSLNLDEATDLYLLETMLDRGLWTLEEYD